MSNRLTAGTLRSFGAILVMCAVLAVASTAYAPPPPPVLMSVDKLIMTMGNGDQRDSLIIGGQFDLPLESTDVIPTAYGVTLWVDNDWSVSFPAEAWKRVGSSHTFVARDAGVTLTITYCIGESSRCLYSLVARRQTLDNMFADPGALTVHLAVGTKFARSVVAYSDVWPHMARLVWFGPGDSLTIRKILLRRNPNADHRDSMVFAGSLRMEGAIGMLNQAASFAADFGPFHMEVPLGQLQGGGNGAFKFKGTLAGGEKVSLSINEATGNVTIAATDLDLSALAPDATVNIGFTDGAGPYWSYFLRLGANKPQTVFRY